MSAAGPAGTLRIFYALWPDEATRDALHAGQAAWQWPGRARLVPRDKLHLTLHFLGQVPLAQVDALVRAEPVDWRAFECRVDRAGRWGGVAWLAPTQAPEALVRLHEALAGQLVRMGLSYDRRAYAPHVTLAREAFGARPPPHPDPVCWAVEEYALVVSRPGPHGGRYEVLRRWPAGSYS